MFRGEGMDERYSTRPGRTGSELVDDEAVIVDFETNHYYCLNPPATVVWSLLSAGPHAAEDVARAIAVHYGRPLDDVRSDVGELLVGLLEEGLVERSDGDAAAQTVDLGAGSSYVAPRFDKFGTLEQLMLAGE